MVLVVVLSEELLFVVVVSSGSSSNGVRSTSDGELCYSSSGGRSGESCRTRSCCS